MFHALALLAFALGATATPVITPAPGAADKRQLLPTGTLTTLPIASCLANIECCANTLSVPVLPASLTSLLPGVTDLPIPIPTLGPLVGLECSSADDLSIIGNQW